MLHRVKRKYRQIGKPAISTELLFRFSIRKKTARSMARIFNNPKVVFIGQRTKSLQIYSSTSKINGNNTGKSSGRSVCYHFANRINVEQIGLRIDVRKNNLATAVAHTIGTGRKGDGCGNYFLPRLHIQRKRAEVKRSSSVRHGYGIPGARVFGKSRFKLRNLGALG